MTIDRFTLPINFCKMTSTKDESIQMVFPNIAQNYKNHQWLRACAILAATNNDVYAINSSIQNRTSGEAATYMSIDTVMNQSEVVDYPTKFLNFLDLPGTPPHVLTLKISVPETFFSNNPPRLFTRLSANKTMNNIIETTIS